MKKKIQAFIIGIIIGSLLFSTVGALEIPVEFFVDENNKIAVTLVVGKKAAAMDVVSTTILAAALGTMTYNENDDLTLTKTYSAVHGNIPLLDEKRGVPTVDVPDNNIYTEWDNNIPSLTYTLQGLWYFDDSDHKFWGNGDGIFQPWETHEEIQLQFTIVNQDASSDCMAGLPGWGFDNDTSENKKWNTIRGDWNTMGGIINRADNIFVPPTILIDVLKEEDQKDETFFPLSKLYPYTVLFVPEPWMVIQEWLPCFSLLGTTYTVVDAGPVLDINLNTGKKGSLHGLPYIITGDPHIEEVFLKKGEPRDFSEYSVELLDVDVDNKRAHLSVSIYGEVLEYFWIPVASEDGFSPDIYTKFPFDAYKCCSDQNKNKTIDPGEVNSVTFYDFNKDGTPDYAKPIVDRIEQGAWADYTWYYYTDNKGACWILFTKVDLVVDAVDIVIEEGAISLKSTVYWLENGKWWYARSCAKPFISDPHDYTLVLDVYQSGWDNRVDESLEYQPPGTGLWPYTGLDLNDGPFVGNGLLDINDGHTGLEYTQWHTLIEGNDLDRDGSITNDCMLRDGSHTECTDKSDIEDPVVWHGDGQIVMELNMILCEDVQPSDNDSWDISGPFCEEKSYFSITVSDTGFDCEDGDGISYTTIFKASVDYSRVEPLDIDETALVVYDTELNFSQWKVSCQYNLILIGGPVANAIVNELVAERVSAVDWEESAGEWEYIKAPFNTCDILIVAGKDRDATRKAAEALADELR
jgi:hypothetical protein